MLEFRIIFEKAVSMFDSLAEHCFSDSRIISDRHFESAICKILSHQVMDSPLNLNTQEARCAAHIKMTNSSPPADLSNVNAEEATNDGDSMTALMRTIKRPKTQAISRYIDCRFIRPTSNMCERFFSASKFAYTDYRKSLDPENLEMQFFLKFNGHLWDLKLFQSDTQ